MRLRRLRLEHFRGVSERTVEFDETGLTVIVAANESGKSSLLEALDLLFALPDDSRASRLRAVQPVGQDVATEVEAELELAEDLLTYRKRWFRQRLSELTVRSAGGSGGSRSFIGREAHDEAARLFGEGVDQTLWSALVAAQGATATVPVAGSVAAVLTALDAVAGGEGLDADGSGADGAPADHRAAAPLLSAVEREYLTYFTPTGRPTGEHAAALRRTEDLAAALAGAEQRLTETREDVSRAERLEAERDALTARLAEREDEVAELGRRQEATAELRATVGRLVTEHELASAHAQTAERIAVERRSLVAELEEQTAAGEAAERTAAERRAALRVEEQETEAAATELRAARDRLAECRAEAARATTWWERRRDHAELAALTERLEAVTAAQEAERAARSALTGLSVDADRLTEIEGAHREVLTRRAALEAGAPTIVVRRLGDATITVAGPASDSEEADAEASNPLEDEPAELTVERRLSVRIGDQAEVEVRPGDGVSALSADARRAEHELAELLASANVADVATARAVARKHAERQRAAAEANEAVRRHAAGESPQRLRERWEELRLRCAEADAADSVRSASDTSVRDDEESTTEAGAQLMLVADPDSERPGFDLVGAEQAVERARADEAAAARRVAEAEQAEVRARKGLESASESATSARVHAEHAAGRRAELAERLSAARVERGDDALEEVARQAAEGVAHLAEAHDNAIAELADSGAERLADEHAAAVESMEQLRAQVAETRDALRHLEGRLEMAGQHGLASQVDQLQVEQAEADRERERIGRRAAAAARLRETVERHRSQARSRYAAPLRERIERLGRVLHDDSFSIALGEQLEVTNRELGGVALPLSSLSLGAREQLAVLVRLAIAELTARDGNGVPVLLDDALGWSDPARLRAMGGLLAHAAATTQVVVLTCVADRYAGLPGVQLIRW